jgi:hypothetical protein
LVPLKTLKNMKLQVNIFYASNNERRQGGGI